MSFASLSTQLAGALAAAWIAWYLWRFVLSARLRADEPKELPYTLPVVGHAIRMMRNAHELFAYGREYFNDKREPFAMTIMGESMYIVTSADDVSVAYRMTKALDYNPFIKELLFNFGLTKDTINKVYDDSFQISKSYMDVLHESFKLQMHPGEKLDSLQQSLLGFIDQRMTWKSLGGHMVTSSSGDERVVSLYKWCQDVLVDATTRAFFDDCIYDKDVGSQLLSLFSIFEHEAWKLPYQYPEFAAKTLYSSKRHCEEALVAYLRLPQEKRKSDSWIVKTMDDSMKSLDIEESQMGRSLFSFYRLVNTNAYKLAFWLVSFLLFDGTLLTEIRKELEPIFNQESLSLRALLEDCPLLNSAYEEALRISNWPMGYRTVVASCILSGKRLQAGRKILMPYRQMHYDPAVFGADVHTFNARRFLENKDLTRSTSWRPFGGAATHCPGRFLARREVLMFVALLLKRFDLDIHRRSGVAPRMPRLDGMPSGGVMGPLAGDDLLLKVRPRTKK